MQLVNYGIEDLLQEIHNGKKLVCFGAGQVLDTFCEMFSSYRIEEYIECIADNNKALWKKEKKLGQVKVKIDSIDNVLAEIDRSVIILITCQHLQTIYKQLQGFHQLEESKVCFHGFIADAYSDWKLENGFMDCNIEHNPKIQIPKIIHYCWFGKNKIPDRYKEWMKSWKKYCPEYEIIEWNENNYDVMKNEYMAQAYETKKWGFVPDYARLDIVYQYGGIYLDTDVEIVRSLDDLLHQKGFCGFQDEYNVNFGLGFGAVEKNEIFAKLRDYYIDLKFRYDNGSLNMIPSPKYQTDCLIDVGLIPDGTYQRVRGVNVYPKIFFSPMNHYNRKIVNNKNTFLIHHFDGSWIDADKKCEWAEFANIYRMI